MDEQVPSAIDSAESRRAARCPFMQNRELSWLTFDERCLDQGGSEEVPLLDRQQFVSIFTSNLQEFFMVRVGSLTDLSLLKKEIIDTKSNMTPAEQLDAIYERCRQLYPKLDAIYQGISDDLAAEGVRRLTFDQLSDEQQLAALGVLESRVVPYLSPQIINARHPFPHLENGAIYIIVRLVEEDERKKSEMTKAERAAAKEARRALKNQGAEGVTLGIIPLPKQAPRVIELPGEGFNYILVEDLIEANVKSIFSMYRVKHTNIVCITRNADLDATEGADEREEDYREHMKKILKKRARLAPVRLESRRKLSSVVSEFLLARLNLQPHQAFVTSVPFDMGFAFALPGMVGADVRARLTSAPFAPSWPGQLQRSRRIIEQVQEHEVLLSYPYESMDPFVQLLREAAADPDVVSVKITLYRLASSSKLAEALISAAEAGKEVTALFELRARFDESNNIVWSQRFEEAGCNVIYGFHDYKVHSKICCITRQTPEGLQHITQLGTGNYNEKTARLYTDFSFITTDEEIGRDAVAFFRNMGLENASSEYETLMVAPLQIKAGVLAGIDEQIELARAGKPCGLFFKTNSITDKQVIEKLAEASQAGVPVTLLVRGISCLLPRVPGYTDNVRVVSIVGRLLEHSRIYGFGPREDMRLYLSSADLMTRNMDKRVEIAWPVRGEAPRERVLAFIDACMSDNVKLRELRADGTYTPLGALAQDGDEEFNAQEYLIAAAIAESEASHEAELGEKTAFEKLSMKARERRRDEQRARAHEAEMEEMYREALKHDMPDEDALAPYLGVAMRAARSIEGVDAAMAPAIAAAIAAAMEEANAQVAAAQAAAAPEPAQEPAAVPGPEPEAASAPEPAAGAAPGLEPAAAAVSIPEPEPAPAAPEVAAETEPAPAASPGPADDEPFENAIADSADDVEPEEEAAADSMWDFEQAIADLAALSPSPATLEAVAAEAAAIFADADEANAGAKPAPVVAEPLAAEQPAAKTAPAAEPDEPTPAQIADAIAEQLAALRPSASVLADVAQEAADLFDAPELIANEGPVNIPEGVAVPADVEDVEPSAAGSAAPAHADGLAAQLAAAAAAVSADAPATRDPDATAPIPVIAEPEPPAAEPEPAAGGADVAAAQAAIAAALAQATAEPEPAAVADAEPQPEPAAQPAPEKKGFFARLFGRK